MKYITCMLAGLLTLQALYAQNTPNDSITQTSSGYYNFTQCAFIIGEINNEPTATSNLTMSVATINGYRISEHVSIGAGFGIASYKYLVFPLFADFRVNIFKGSFTPVLIFQAGYSFADSNKEIFTNYLYEAKYKNTGGVMCNPAIGFKTTINEHCDFMLTVGYYYQKLETKITTPNNPHSYGYSENIKTNLNRVSFTFGFTFR